MNPSTAGAQLELRDLQVTIEKIPILRGFSVTLGVAETVGLVGRNGAGKTTTMRAIMGLIGLSGGDIVFDGQSLRSAASHKRAKLGIGYMPEDRRLIPELTVQENILLPSWVVHVPDARRHLEEIYDLMPEVARLADRKALLLSGGQQKLVALGRAMLAGQRLLLLDEPFEGIAPALVKRLEEVLGQLRQGSRRTVFISDSTLDRTKAVYDRYVLIERGANEVDESAAAHHDA